MSKNQIAHTVSMLDDKINMLCEYLQNVSAYLETNIDFIEIDKIKDILNKLSIDLASALFDLKTKEILEISQYIKESSGIKDTMYILATCSLYCSPSEALKIYERHFQWKKLNSQLNEQARNTAEFNYIDIYKRQLKAKMARLKYKTEETYLTLENDLAPNEEQILFTTCSSRDIPGGGG